LVNSAESKEKRSSPYFLFIIHEQRRRGKGELKTSKKLGRKGGTKWQQKTGELQLIKKKR
jgi:hypothetical protein